MIIRALYDNPNHLPMWLRWTCGAVLPLIAIFAIFVFNSHRIFKVPQWRDPATISNEEWRNFFRTQKQIREHTRRFENWQWLKELKNWFYESNVTVDASLKHSVSQMNTFWNYHEKQFIEGELDHDQFRLALQHFLFPESKPQPPHPPSEPPKADPPPKDERPWWSPRKNTQRDRIDV
jgi:hypothetical protein